METLVFGAGSLGSLIGGLLARAHDVTLVGRDPHVTAVRESELDLTGEFDLAVTPGATTSLDAGAFDCVVVTVKTFDTAEAARALAGVDAGVVVSLQNGMGNEGVLADALDCPVLAGTCTYGARLLDPGVVECTGRGEVAVGPREGGRSTEADRVAAAFRGGGVDAVAATDMPPRLWEKLAVNAGINAATALARVENGALVDGPASGTAREAARETGRVAREVGVEFDAERGVAAVESVADATAANVSSMRADVESGSRTEVDAITGYVVDRAERPDVPVPVSRTLTELVRAWERGRELR
jgi:2-dehydropantoate 2-reductase